MTWKVTSTNLECLGALGTTQIQWGKVQIQQGDRTVTITDPVIDAGLVIPGFHDEFTGGVPDLGALERERSPIRFGRDADPDFRPASWE